ncbi:MAG: LysE family transporter [Chlorobi bacterium]|nr:LysE family transporter [Chlorobiota bacterium]
MFESILTVALIGFFAGFVFSMPVAGPVSIIITSNALKGNRTYCIRTAFGASTVEFFYVFAAIFGITSLYSSYKSAIPYLLIFGSVVIILIGVKIFKTKLDIDNLDETKIKKKPKTTGGFRTGAILNVTNPSLFISWLAASFMLFSFASSIGLNTGGLDLIVEQNVIKIAEETDTNFKGLDSLKTATEDEDKAEISQKEKMSSILLALIYAAAVALGAFIWFFYLIKALIKYRHKVNVNILNYLIRGLGVALIGIAFYLIYQGIILL